MSADRLLSVEEALERVFAAIAGPTEPEVAWLSEARGRVAAEAVTSPIALPPWDNSAMDGYAIRAADTSRSPPRTRPVDPRGHRRGPLRARRPRRTVRRGTAVRIATGAPVPPGADAVIPVEATTPLDATGATAGRARPRRDRSGAGTDRRARGGVRGGSIRRARAATSPPGPRSSNPAPS